MALKDDRVVPEVNSHRVLFNRSCHESRGYLTVHVMKVMREPVWPSVRR